MNQQTYNLVYIQSTWNHFFPIDDSTAELLQYYLQSSI